MNAAQDMVAVGWPPVIRQVAQAIHYRRAWWDAFCDDHEFKAAMYSSDILPTKDTFRRCTSGRPEDQIRQRHGFCFDLIACRHQGLFNSLLKEPSTNCAVNRLASTSLRSILNGPKTLQEAKKKLKCQMRMVHPDKIDALHRMSGKPLPKPFPTMSRDALEFLALVRKVLDHPVVGPALFCQERASYGQLGSGFVAVIGCILSLVATVIRWAKYGHNMRQINMILAAEIPSAPRSRTPNLSLSL